MAEAPMSNEEFQAAKAMLRQIEDMEKLGVKQGSAWVVAKLDLEIQTMEYRLYLKKKERESWN